MKKFFLVILLFGCLAGFFAIKDYVIPSTWNYRITVEIETPEGVKSGSAVRQVVAARTLAFNPDVPSIRFNVSGEAVVIDLGERGILFALIDSNSFEEVFNAFPSGHRNVTKKVEYYKSLKVGGTAELIKNLPRFVTFTDINDPMSVKRVDKKKMNDAFGDGVRLKRIFIEKTNNPVKWGIKKMLPWLIEYYGKRFDGNRFGTIEAINRTANSLSAGAFSTKGKE